MGYHHVAIATRDIKASHEFYTGPMGFELVKVQVGPAGERGFAKHLFYDTGNGADVRDLGLPRSGPGAGLVARDLDRRSASRSGPTTSPSTPATSPTSHGVASAGSRTAST